MVFIGAIVFRNRTEDIFCVEGYEFVTRFRVFLCVIIVVRWYRGTYFKMLSFIMVSQ